MKGKRAADVNQRDNRISMFRMTFIPFTLLCPFLSPLTQVFLVQMLGSQRLLLLSSFELHVSSEKRRIRQGILERRDA